MVVLCSGAKVTLAARVDSFHESTDGHIGIEYKEDIEKKIDKVSDSFLILVSGSELKAVFIKK